MNFGCLMTRAVTDPEFTGQILLQKRQFFFFFQMSINTWTLNTQTQIDETDRR